MANQLDINIPSPGSEETDSGAVMASPAIDLDALLRKIQETKPSTGGTGRAPSQLASKVAEAVKELAEKAGAAGLEKLPLGTTVKTIAVAMGVDVDKKSQYFYTLGQSVLKILGESFETEKDGRTLYLICKK